MSDRWIKMKVEDAGDDVPRPFPGATSDTRRWLNGRVHDDHETDNGTAICLWCDTEAEPTDEGA